MRNSAPAPVFNYWTYFTKVHCTNAGATMRMRVRSNRLEWPAVFPVASLDCFGAAVVRPVDTRMEEISVKTKRLTLISCLAAAALIASPALLL